MPFEADKEHLVEGERIEDSWTGEGRKNVASMEEERGKDVV